MLANEDPPTSSRACSRDVEGHGVHINGEPSQRHSACPIPLSLAVSPGALIGLGRFLVTTRRKSRAPAKPTEVESAGLRFERGLIGEGKCSGSAVRRPTNRTLRERALGKDETLVGGFVFEFGFPENRG